MDGATSGASSTWATPRSIIHRRHRRDLTTRLSDSDWRRARRSSRYGSSPRYGGAYQPPWNRPGHRRGGQGDPVALVAGSRPCLADGPESSNSSDALEDPLTLPHVSVATRQRQPCSGLQLAHPLAERHDVVLLTTVWIEGFGHAAGTWPMSSVGDLRPRREKFCDEVGASFVGAIGAVNGGAGWTHETDLQTASAGGQPDRPRLAEACGPCVEVVRLASQHRRDLRPRYA